MATASAARDVARASGDLSAGEEKEHHILRRTIFPGKRRTLSAPEKENALVGCPQCTEHQQQRDNFRQIGHFLSATIDALVTHIVVLDSAGVIVAANAAWQRFAKENQGDERTC